MPHVDNTPQGGLKKVKPETILPIMTALHAFHDMPKPKTDEEIEQRIADYFRACEKNGLRPGVESMALALGIRRETLWRWEHGVGCSKRVSEAVQHAKGLLAAFWEQTFTQGKLNPVSGIFLAKNWLGYSDTPPEDIHAEPPVKTAEEIMSKYMNVPKPVPEFEND